jgi:hypothetical protein
MAAEHLHGVTSDVLKQTLEESQIEHTFDFDAFTIYHGTRYGSPIVIAQPNDENCLGAVWYDESIEGDRR